MLELGPSAGDKALAGLPSQAGLEHMPPPTMSSAGAATLGDILAACQALCPVPSPGLSPSHLLTPAIPGRQFYPSSPFYRW